ncbi:flagellar biosynthesis repressor FlbT [Bradyrhizobium sp. U87765 SZCCT0131]|uniref:flagellar biosynthesis repressor FlbT n=1 Tax=unclassified Bradyrhizobium TaxID=2631580 RepID=UPI001BADC052|nr:MULTISPECIES: flagellar biosynthesis repressor FlbT [unclassified Bradyrhizobium]MBR1216375.1 flagellar biosynthesis repressor FlbT [Bradyrhizobium sp. U87765 SZCCT0131]MBR1259877.1 flagellar biosynthesis repressor FlbT [Bradyrhizobium sp. U87765 SZCCT0134]MBR1306010.1 flagellar biosynthesis repressor FlbT [Bradyrhizobium sp. U87765 SZCCT0110]MBR1322377.1 flagellar biosynthesis repressor FlbT [Bradyrhizobium sp. U87765 SZCCT0109]MBR1352332.1 flagellar biosynthesis repressor FlbT [Bradyrhizo
MCISLRAGERIYINGAVLRVDRKVTLELVNDVNFLLENQVMQVTEATTPLRQLYFVVQLMLMTPQDVSDALAIYCEQYGALRRVSENGEILTGLAAINELVDARRYYEALRRIRALFVIEQVILSGGDAPPTAPAVDRLNTATAPALPRSTEVA